MTPPTTRLFRFALAFAVTAACFALVPAFAERNRQPVSVSFKYNPADSAETNYRNLVVKVKRACNYARQGPIALASPADREDCVAQMTDRAVAQLGRSDVMAAHQAATGITGRRELAAQ